ncbi:Putative calmodulin-binding protein [Heterostelium album PN500]|uniref:Calmodulin-binding protein n=1 Tax=Heterostelium pallidum (strain ATCC 26659 / Pp 5 / PN500) TaxID=670386 RepID=D3B7K8_HETP5|nr:Putative calmodulin-binding protein [Heterostelium album PN500]EFA82751.1 Putative calmodulin-binding protein [Heterostelium album PN500]|eukprot:XP_020434868.1 Putative calmodulin-binding protein [Heterostelium album PN500]
MKDLSTFPLILLQKIISFVDDPIDQICFTLTCKQCFYQLPEKYTFNTTDKELYDSSHYNGEFFLLKSFKSPILKSIETKSYKLSYFYETNYQIYKKNLPVGITHLAINELYTRDFYENELPETLKSLVFERYAKFNLHFTEGSLPQSLRVLTLGVMFQQPIYAGDFPPLLEELNFGDGYDLPFEVGVLPPALKTLTFGHSFNQPLKESVLPNGLTKLVFGDKFNQTLEQLPPSITKLTVGANFNQLIPERTLLPKLRSLTLHGSYPHLLALPSVDKLKSIGYMNTPLLTHLKGNLIAEHNGPLLQKISFDRFYNTSNIAPGLIPSSVGEIVFGYWFNSNLKVGVFPNGLTRLDFGNTFNEVLDAGLLPPTLLSLQLGGRYLHKLVPGVLPASLESLEFGTEKSRYTRKELSLAVPASLTYLALPIGYNDDLPPFVKTVKLLENTACPKRCLNYSMFATQPFGSTIEMKVNVYDSIQIRRLDNRYSLVISQYIDGGYIESKRLSDGSFFEEIECIDESDSEEGEVYYDHQVESMDQDDDSKSKCYNLYIDSDRDDTSEDEADQMLYAQQLRRDRSQEQQQQPVQIPYPPPAQQYNEPLPFGFGLGVSSVPPQTTTPTTGSSFGSTTNSLAQPAPSMPYFGPGVTNVSYGAFGSTSNSQQPTTGSFGSTTNSLAQPAPSMPYFGPGVTNISYGTFGSTSNSQQPTITPPPTLGQGVTSVSQPSTGSFGSTTNSLAQPAPSLPYFGPGATNVSYGTFGSTPNSQQPTIGSFVPINSLAQPAPSMPYFGPGATNVSYGTFGSIATNSAGSQPTFSGFNGTFVSMSNTQTTTPLGSTTNPQPTASNPNFTAKPAKPAPTNFTAKPATPMNFTATFIPKPAKPAPTNFTAKPATPINFTAKPMNFTAKSTGFAIAPSPVSENPPNTNTTDDAVSVDKDKEMTDPIDLDDNSK